MSKRLRKRTLFAKSLFASELPAGWRLVTVGDVLTGAEYGLSEPGDSEGDTPIVGMRDINNGSVSVVNLATINGSANDWSKLRLRVGDILLNRTNSPDLVGKVGIVREDSNAVFASYLVRLNINRKTVDAEYLNAWLNGAIAQKALKRLSTRGVSQANINPTEFQRHCPLPLPELTEQQEIARILRTWDKAIEKVDRLIGLVTKQRSAVCQGIFESDYAAGGSLLRAREIFMPVSERARPDLPLLAVMQDIGIVRRDELDRRVTMPEGDTSTYKVVRPGDFVISLRSFEGGLEYSSITGLVSPAYTVLRPTRPICAEYYRHFFKSRSFIGRLDRMIFGIRDGKQIAFRDFGDMFIPYPRIEDQEHHERALGTAERLIEVNLRKKQAFESQKRGLMQKLLTGEWRLPC